MGKARSVGSYNGTLTMSTGDATTDWIDIPAVIANKIHGTATFSGTTGNSKLQGRLSSSSTAVTLLITRTYANRSAVIASTVATAVSQIRATSTSVQAGGTNKFHFAIVP